MTGLSQVILVFIIFFTKNTFGQNNSNGVSIDQETIQKAMNAAGNIQNFGNNIDIKNIVEGIKSITEDDVVKFGSSLSNAIQSAMNSNDSVKDVASKLKAENSDFLKKINTVGEAVNATQAKLVAIYDKLSPNVKTWFTQLCSVLEQMKNESSTAEQEQLQLLKGVLTTYSTFTQTDLDSIKSVSESAHTIATNPELKAQIQSFINNPTSETAKLIGEQLNNAVVDIFTKAP